MTKTTTKQAREFLKTNPTPEQRLAFSRANRLTLQAFRLVMLSYETTAAKRVSAKVSQ